jgi:hypothetical protein
MTFDAWWELLRWGAVPLGGLLIWWVRDIQARHRHQFERLYERIESEVKARHAESEQCRREHREAVKALHDDLNAWKLDAASRFASAAHMERGFEKLENAIQGLGSRLERWIEGRQTGGD